jgi:hypothetical protein
VPFWWSDSAARRPSGEVTQQHREQLFDEGVGVEVSRRFVAEPAHQQSDGLHHDDCGRPRVPDPDLGAMFQYRPHNFDVTDVFLILAFAAFTGTVESMCQHFAQSRVFLVQGEEAL